MRPACGTQKCQLVWVGASQPNHVIPSAGQWQCRCEHPARPRACNQANQHGRSCPSKSDRGRGRTMAHSRRTHCHLLRGRRRQIGPLDWFASCGTWTRHAQQTICGGDTIRMVTRRRPRWERDGSSDLPWSATRLPCYRVPPLQSACKAFNQARPKRRRRLRLRSPLRQRLQSCGLSLEWPCTRRHQRA